MSEKKTYEFEGLTFEFSPNGDPFAGLLRVESGDAVFMAEVKLGSLRSRKAYAEAGAEEGLDGAGLRRALNELCSWRADEVEAAAEAEGAGEEHSSEENAAPEAGSEEEAQALTLLEDPNILERAVKDLVALGHVGEYNAKALAFTCALSARRGEPIQPSTHAGSAAGKNALWDTVLSLFPEEMVVDRTGFSAKALYRTEVDLRGAILYLQEVEGSADADYSIRAMQSSGRLTYEVPEKQPDGSIKNQIHTTEGPTVIVQTTTRNHLHAENETRVFPIYIDESQAQTRRIVSSILSEAEGSSINEGARKAIRKRWADAIRLLEPAEVVIPYAGRMKMPTSQVRIRRDARRVIEVIRVIAWLHQYQRQRDEAGAIVATEEDFHQALRLVSESLRRAWATLTPAEERVMAVVKELGEGAQKQGFKRRDLKVGGVSDRGVKAALKSLTDTGYLDCDGRSGPQGYTYTLSREVEEVSLGISLCPLPDKGQSRKDTPDSTGHKGFARYCPMPDSIIPIYLSGLSGKSGHKGSARSDSPPRSEKADYRAAGKAESENTNTTARDRPLSFEVAPGESASLADLKARRHPDDFAETGRRFEERHSPAGAKSADQGGDRQGDGGDRKSTDQSAPDHGREYEEAEGGDRGDRQFSGHQKNESEEDAGGPSRPLSFEVAPGESARLCDLKSYANARPLTEEENEAVCNLIDKDFPVGAARAEVLGEELVQKLIAEGFSERMARAEVEGEE